MRCPCAPVLSVPTTSPMARFPLVAEHLGRPHALGAGDAEGGDELGAVGDGHPPHQHRAALRQCVPVEHDRGVAPLRLRRWPEEMRLPRPAEVLRTVVLAVAAGLPVGRGVLPRSVVAPAAPLVVALRLLQRPPHPCSAGRFSRILGLSRIARCRPTGSTGRFPGTPLGTWASVRPIRPLSPSWSLACWFTLAAWLVAWVKSPSFSLDSSSNSQRVAHGTDSLLGFGPLKAQVVRVAEASGSCCILTLGSFRPVHAGFFWRKRAGISTRRTANRSTGSWPENDHAAFWPTSDRPPRPPIELSNFSLSTDSGPGAVGEEGAIAGCS